MSTSYPFTVEDLKNAMYANGVDYEAERELWHAKEIGIPLVSPLKTEKQRVRLYEQQLTSCDLNDPEDHKYFNEREVPEGVARYKRGKQVLATCEVAASKRSIVLGESHYEEMVKGKVVMSPAVRWPAGYIATNEAERYYVLVQLNEKEMKQREEKRYASDGKANL